MLEHLYEINRVLLSVNSLIQEDKGAKTDYVIEDLEKLAIYARSSDSESNISACVKLGIIEKKGDRLFITKKGNKFFNLRTVEKDKTNIDVNHEQKKYLLELIFDSMSHRKELQKICSSFRIDYKKKIWFYNSTLPGSDWSKEMLNLLFQLDFLISKNNRIEVTESTSHYVSRVIHRILKSEENLIKVLGSQRKIGDIAEKLTLNHEKSRLEKKGYVDLSLMIQQISKEDVFAGFDIMSFNGKNSSLEYDRFIEVKGTSGIEPIFYWSKNEIEKAKKLGKRYWIYLWTEVKFSFNGILFGAIQDPYRVLFSRKEKRPEPVRYMVEL